VIRDNLSAKNHALVNVLAKTADADSLGSLSETDWAAMTEFAITKNLAPLLFHRLRQCGLDGCVPDPVREKLSDSYLASAAMGALLSGQLKLMLNALGAGDIPVIVLKGAHLAHNVYENPALRPMIDIDLLVRQEDLSTAESIMGKLGYHSPGKVWIDAPDPTWKHLPRMFKTDAMPVEIHWTIRDPNNALEIQPDKLWDRAVASEYAGAFALALSPEDLLLHLCLHAVHHHAFQAGLRDICDVDQTIRRHADELNWQILADRAKEWKASASAWIALNSAASLLGTPVPEDFLDALKPPHVDDELISWLYARLLGHSAGFSSPGFSNLVQKGGIASPLRTLAKAMFPSRRDMSGMYPISASSFWIVLYYPIRWVDLIRRYLPMLWSTILGDDKAKVMAENQVMRRRLRKWLQG
jgi:Uncharacterised nucleotidyltransferase